MVSERLAERFFAGTPRYRNLATIGRGSMGVVFKALDLELDEVVAIKVLAPRLDVDDPDVLLRFKREIHLNRRIKHPNVARLHDFGMSGDFPFLTMEFIPGRNLKALIEEEGPMGLDPARAISILRQICLGTHAAHQAGIIHRDLKSSNVIVDEDGAVAILDFGLARLAEGQGVTLAATFLGTPHYVSPEQALGKPLDVRSDIYSIGIVAYETLTGTLPFRGDSPLVIAMRHVTDPVPEDLAMFPGVTPQLAAVVQRALAKEPAERFASAADLEAALAQTLHRAPSGGQPTVQPVPPGEPPAAAGPLPAAAPEPEEPRPPEPLHSPLVLVVEDEEDAREFAIGALEAAGCRTRRADSGAVALELLHQGGIDLVVMDTTLPGLDGFDTTRVVKSIPELAPTPVLLTTHKLDRSSYAFGIQSGATDLLNRPYPVQALVALAWKVLLQKGFALPPGVTISPPAADTSATFPKLPS